MRTDGFRLDVQGLRAIAVLAVIAFHASNNFLSAGFLGVDVFFVISGYIITSLIVEAGTSFKWRYFYMGRVKRIVPAYVFMLLIVSIFSSFLFIPSDFLFFKQSLYSALLFYSNNYFSHFGSYFAPGSHELPLLHTWSLAIEMQFYLFFPLLIWLTPRRCLTLLISVLCVGLFILAEWRLQVQVSQREVYYSLLARIPEFLMGALVAVAGAGRELSDRRSAVLGGVGFIVLVWCFINTNSKSFPGLAAFLPCFATALVLISRSGPVSSLLSHRILVWLGAVSYSLYLWHWPILALMRYYLGSYELPLLWLFWFLFLTIAISWFSYRFVESPARSSVGIFNQAARVWLLGVACTFVFVCALVLNKSVEKPLSESMTRYAPLSEICHGQIVGDCIRGEKNSEANILVLGDSHAAQLNEFFDVAGKADNFSARVITASNCVPLPKFDVERIPDYSRTGCRSQIAEVSKYVDTASTIVVAGMWQWQAQSEQFMQALSSFLDYTSERNIRVIVFAQIPMFDNSVMRVRRFAALGIPITITKNKEWEADNDKVLALVQRYQSVEFFNLSHSDFFKNAPFRDGELIYQDSHHLNEIGSRSFGLFSAAALKVLLSKSTLN